MYLGQAQSTFRTLQSSTGAADRLRHQGLQTVTSDDLDQIESNQTNSCKFPSLFLGSLLSARSGASGMH